MNHVRANYCTGQDKHVTKYIRTHVEYDAVHAGTHVAMHTHTHMNMLLCTLEHTLNIFEHCFCCLMLQGVYYYSFVVVRNAF